jgi:hypothetical protein
MMRPTAVSNATTLPHLTNSLHHLRDEIGLGDVFVFVRLFEYLGFFDRETGRITSAENPFGAKVLSMSPE